MNLTKEMMLRALKELEEILPKPVSLIVGGGGALLLTDRFPLATEDIDAVPRGITADELGDLVKKVALKLNLPGDWLNPWFSSFTHVLPSDFEARLRSVYQGSRLKVLALGSEDMLIMKCFAHRKKDIPHARALVREGLDLNLVESQIESLKKKKIPHASEALIFLDQILEMEEG